jgi:hypothetical protein
MIYLCGGIAVETECLVSWRQISMRASEVLYHQSVRLNETSVTAHLCAQLIIPWGCVRLVV